MLRMLFLGAVFVVLAVLSLAPASAETCLSPFVKRLDRPEKILYVFCVDADAKDNDFLAVIDVQPESKTYGKIIYQLDLGSSGNETHHFGFTDDRTHIWGCSLFSSRIFIINVADEPGEAEAGEGAGRRAREGGPERAALAVCHAGADAGFVPRPARTAGCRPGLAEFTNDGKYIRTLPMPKDVALRLRRGHQAGPEPHGHVELHAAAQLQEAAGEDGPEGLRQGRCSSGTSASARCCKR